MSKNSITILNKVQSMSAVKVKTRIRIIAINQIFNVHGQIVTHWMKI